MSDRMFDMAMRDLQQIKYSEILEQNAKFRSQLLDRAEEIRTLTTQRDQLVKALEEIAGFAGLTLIAPSLGPAGDEAHQTGANKAYEQCAEIAREALSQTKEGGA